jgi:alpha-amylase/alpha-mannosidase (GH57 family)
MEKVAFLFCVHNHQPVGNFTHVLESAYQKAYRPFIEVLKKYPFLKVSIHYTGILWDFFMDHHPEFLETLRNLVKNGQLEMMTGGYYEPILAVIPDEDKVGQMDHPERDGSCSQGDVAGGKGLGASSSKALGGSRCQLYHDRRLSFQEGRVERGGSLWLLPDRRRRESLKSLRRK